MHPRNLGESDAGVRWITDVAGDGSPEVGLVLLQLVAKCRAISSEDEVRKSHLVHSLSGLDITGVEGVPEVTVPCKSSAFSSFVPRSAGVVRG